MQSLKSLGQIGSRCAPGGLAALICAAIIGAAGATTAHAQGSIPVLRGVYLGIGAGANCFASGSYQVTLTITSQVNDNFSGQAVNSSGAGATVFLEGTVDSSGHLEGTYEYADAGVSGSGTFAGQFVKATPSELHITFTGTITVPNAGTCGEILTFDGTLLTAGGVSADLSITGSASPTPAASGNNITYTLTVSNAGPNDASSTLVINPAPIGLSIVAATSSQGACSTTPGSASCSLGTVSNRGTATITITAEVLESGGSTLVDSPNVSSVTFDPNLSNNSTTITTPVMGGAVIQLSFTQQPASGGNPTPAPANLQASPAAAKSSASASSASAPSASAWSPSAWSPIAWSPIEPSASAPSASAPSASAPSASAWSPSAWSPIEPSASAPSGSAASGSAASASAMTAPADACTLTGVHIYKSAQPNVQPIPANLFTTLPPTSLQANVPVAPSGASFVLTNLWTCGSAPMESGVSNEVDVLPGPTITGLKVTGKLKVLGSGFAGQVHVFVDGVEFVKAAVLADSTLLVQKGPLTDGTAISDIGTSKPVLITVKNGDGGFASFTFKRP